MSHSDPFGAFRGRDVPHAWNCGHCGAEGKGHELLLDSGGDWHCPDCCSSSDLDLGLPAPLALVRITIPAYTVQCLRGAFQLAEGEELRLVQVLDLIGDEIQVYGREHDREVLDAVPIQIATTVKIIEPEDEPCPTSE